MRQAHEEAVFAIEAFVDGRGRAWDWDDYESATQDDPFLESIRLRCCRVPTDYFRALEIEYVPVIGDEPNHSPEPKPPTIG